MASSVVRTDSHSRHVSSRQPYYRDITLAGRHQTGLMTLHAIYICSYDLFSASSKQHLRTVLGSYICIHT